MNRNRILAALAGAGILVGIILYAGLGSVVQALRILQIGGLALIAALHLPVVLAMGIAWWMLGRDVPGATVVKFAWARMVRDAASEVLPFSQLGGFVLGIRALHLGGVGALSAALSMSVDLVVELWAKVPYFAGGILALAISAHRAAPSEAIFAALGLTIAVVSGPLLLRRRLRRALEISALAVARRWPSLGDPDDAKTFFDELFAAPRRLAAAFAIHLLCWVFGAFEMWVVLALMDIRVGPLEALAIDSLVSGLRAFGFLVPAAAGVQEASYVLVCAFFGIPPAAAVAVSLARRARDLVLGLPVLGIWHYTEARPVRTTAGK